MASKLVTVFGGSGFLGRRIVEHLAAAGHDVRVGVRHPDRATFLRRLDADGRIELVQADVWDEATVARAVEGAASVINTVGHYVEKGSTTFDRIHGEGALHVARQAKQAGVLRLIHISGLGADPGSSSPYVRARGTGESLVKEAFDGVTILRPGVIFGPGDSFLNRLAMLARQSPVLPLFGTGGTRLQPVFVENVAEACVRVLADPSTQCRVYELGGPRVYAYRELIGLVLDGIGRRRVMIPCVDAPVDASIFRTAWCMRSGAVVCPASRLRRFSGRRACMEIRGSGPYRFRELERSTGSAWFSRPGLVDRLPLPVLRPAHIPDGSRVSLPVQAAAGAR